MQQNETKQKNRTKQIKPPECQKLDNSFYIIS